MPNRVLVPKPVPVMPIQGARFWLVGVSASPFLAPPGLRAGVGVRQRELDVWRERPNPLFTVSAIRPYVGSVRYVLGTYDLPDE